MSSPSSEPVVETVLRPHRRIVELDALRALAAVSLVLFHLTHVYSNKFGFTSPLGFQWNYGAYGTAMFFILSGFVNSMSLLRRGRPVDFVAARMIRIVPVFFLAILANLFLLSFAPLNEPVSTARLCANLTLLPRVFGYECLDPVMWTLQIEMMFYFTLVTMFRLGALKRYFVGWGTLLALSATVCPLLDALSAAYGMTSWFAVATAIRRLMLLDFVPLFAIGFGLYMIKTKVGHLALNIAGIVAALAVFTWIDHGKHNPKAMVMIVGLVTLCAYGKMPLLRFKPLLYISTISYALYLCHNNMGSIVMHRLDRGGYPPVVALAIALAFSWAVAVLVTTRIEAPLSRFLRSTWERYRRGEKDVSTSVASV
ncbi:MAG: acyltransferase [Planctomycetota bacterium]